ncbi:MAG: hypothetical protein H7Y06_04510, partial [Opitutaceae bacterium]|nr:hypothetical protein [Opitutaceae bacterium]
MSATSTPFFNAHHSPIGAFASLTLGQPGCKGGFGLEREGPANEDVFVAVQDLDAHDFHALPFFAGADSTDAARYDVEGASGSMAAGAPDHAKNEKRQPVIRAFALDSVQRDFGLCRDTWRAGDLAFTIYTQLVAIPDPATAANADTAALRDALVPAVWAELTIDNRAGRKPRRGFFGNAGKDPDSRMRTWGADDFVAAGQGGHIGIFARAEPGVQ